jgi:amino-acid N-acetyltransferase
MTDRQQWVSWFRQASPYINAHRDKTFVIALSGEALAHPNIDPIIHDLALLTSLGVRLVIVFGGRPQIDAMLLERGIECQFHQGLRVTTPEIIGIVLSAYGMLRAELEAKLSMGVVNSPMHGAKIRVVSGNFVVAKPYGVNEGIDFGHTGKVRRIETAAIGQQLASGAVVLVPAQGYSMTGEAFNLGYEILAAELARAMRADKLIYLGESFVGPGAAVAKPSQLTLPELQRMLDGQPEGLGDGLQRQFHAAALACSGGVARVHLLPFAHDGALLEELFTRDGLGLMVSLEGYDQIRPAQIEDVNGILELIQPLEETGFLIRRSRERLENELDYFLVDIRDNAIVGCVGLYPYPSVQSGELSCFAVHPDYRAQGRGDRLLQAVVKKARGLNYEKLYVLTTKTEHWFRERGFEPIAPACLPGEKVYNLDRKAKVLVKQI